MTPPAIAQERPAKPQDPGAVHLTFDDGPERLFTPILLDLLDRHGAQVTFFPLGRNLQRRWGSDEVQDLLNRGHAVGNHSVHHRPFTKEHPWRVAADLAQASELLADRTGFRPSCFRAPYGDRDAVVDEIGSSLGMAHVGWTADPQEWRDPWVPLVVDYLTRQRRDGAVVLLHDRKWLALHIVDEVVPRFLADGWRFEALSACRPEGEREARMATRSRGEVPVGRVEALVNTDDGMTVVGWGYDADAPHGGLVVRAAIDGDRVVDLASTGTDHGFSAILPADVRLPLCLWLVDAGIPRHDSSLGCHRPRPVPDWDPPTG